MKSLKSLERLQQLHERIKQENTGTPREMASFMNISERLFYKYIEQLKDLSAPIRYCRRRRTYYYFDDFELYVSISVTALYNDEIIEILGGGYFLKKNVILKGLCSENYYFGPIKANNWTQLD